MNNHKETFLHLLTLAAKTAGLTAIVTLLSLLLASAVVIGTASADPGADDSRTRSIAAVLLYKLTYPSTIKAGHPRQIWHCRKAVDGCASRVAAFDQFFHDATADKVYATDPWLLAAMAYKETGMNPYAVGAANEMGLLQLHPRNKHARGLKFHRSEAYRQRCRKVVGACQAEVVAAAAEVLEASIATCDGEVLQGLGMYNTGRCDADIFYVRKVTEIRAELLQLATEPTREVDEI